VPLDALLKAVAGARSKIVILDACRDDPFAQCPPQRGVRRVSFGELTVPEAESYLLVSSTKPGQEALDGPTGAHSPYTRALLEWLEKTPELFRAAARARSLASGAIQTIKGFGWPVDVRRVLGPSRAASPFRGTP
jgi:Caspase domain